MSCRASTSRQSQYLGKAMVGWSPARAILQLTSSRSLEVFSSNARTTPYRCVFCQARFSTPRHFSASTIRRKTGEDGGRGSFGARLRVALRGTKVQWYPIPVGLGIGFLGFAQLYRQQQQRERLRREDEAVSGHGPEEEADQKRGRPRKRERIRPSGPW